MTQIILDLTSLLSNPHVCSNPLSQATDRIIPNFCIPNEIKNEKKNIYDSNATFFDPVIVSFKIFVQFFSFIMMSSSRSSILQLQIFLWSDFNYIHELRIPQCSPSSPSMTMHINDKQKQNHNVKSGFRTSNRQSNQWMTRLVF